MFTNITKQGLDIYTTVVTNRFRYHDLSTGISPCPDDYSDDALEKAAQFLAESISKDLDVPVDYVNDGEEPDPRYKNLCFKAEWTVKLTEKELLEKLKREGSTLDEFLEQLNEELREKLKGYTPKLLQILLYNSGDLGRGANWRDMYELTYHDKRRQPAKVF